MNQQTFGSDLIVDQLTNMGVKLVSFAPGATFRGIHDSLVHHRADGPEIIECLHEEISVAVAHGYAKATGELPVVLLHDVVGLQHAAMAIYNAWCDQVPLLLLGGSGPADAVLRRPWIDWIHTANTQGLQVRDYTKWDDQPASLGATLQSLVRGRQLARSTPGGPVYIAIDTTIQESEVGSAGPAVIETASTPPASAVVPEPELIERVIDRLRSADRPLIAVESVGRQQSGMDDLVTLAETFGVPVTEMQRDYNRTELCMPSDSPLNVSGMQLPWQPDLVLALGVKDIAALDLPESVPTIHVTTADLGLKAWSADGHQVHRAEALIPVAPHRFLRAMTSALQARRGSGGADGHPAEVERRIRAVTEHTESARRRWRAIAAGQSSITPALMAARIDALTSDYPRTLANGSLHNWVHRLWRLSAVDQYLGSSGGAGLGYGLGASIGAALAYRDSDRLVIDIQSDGDALMSPQALWTAARHRAPLLVIVENNRMWGNSYVHAKKIAESRGRILDRAALGTAVNDPAVDFAGFATAMGVAHTATVTSIDELDQKLADARDYVLERRLPAVVDVLVESDGVG